MAGQRLLPLWILLVLALGACGGAENTTGGSGLFENIGARHDATSRGGALYESPLGAMPQVRYVIDGSEPISVAEAWVIGRVVSVEEGRSFRWTETGDEETRHEVEFNAPDAQVSTIHVTVSIERSIVDSNQPKTVHTSLAPGRTATFALALSAPVRLGAAEAELRASSQLGALLYRPSPVFDYAPELWAVLEDGAFLGQVRDGVVEFPALDGHDTGNGDAEADGSHGPNFDVAQLEAPQRDGPISVTYDAESGRYKPSS